MLKWTLGVFSILVLWNIGHSIESYSQWISVPLPSSISSKYENCCNISSSNETLNSNNTAVSLLTNTLHEGKNILKFKIQNEEPIIFKELTYTSGNDTLTTNLAKSLNDEYRALVDVHAPKTKISLITTDEEFHSSHFDRTLVVDHQDFWSHLNENFKNLFKW